MKDNQAKYPQLRFKGFTDPWEQRKLGTIYDFGKGKGLPLDSFIYSSNNPAIAYGHLYTKYSEVISEVFWSSNDNGVLSKDNDLLFPGSSTVPNGTAQANAITLNNVKLGGDIIIGRPKEGVGVLSTFMSYQVNSQRQKLFPITVGTTITHMYGKDISKLNFFITDYSEQEKIASFFKQLDDIIALHQRKLAKLKELKQGYLQKLFPKNGSKFPQLRFAGFADAWEKRKLGELTKISSAARVHKDEWTSSGVRFFRSSDVVSLFKGQVNTPAFISENLYDKLSEKSGVPSVGDILITGGGSIGIPYVIGPIWPLYFKDADLIWLKSRATFNSFFLFYYLQTPIYRTHLRAISHIGTIAHFTIEQAEETPLKITVLDEQNSIASILTKFDDLIAATQCKLDLLKKLKKGYLQKMLCWA